jgi:hypothetical protein
LVNLARLLDSLHHAFKILDHLSIRESHHPISMCLEQTCSGRVVIRLIRRDVGVTVDLDANSDTCAVEVRNETPEQDMLAADMDAQGVVAHPVP